MVRERRQQVPAGAQAGALRDLQHPSLHRGDFIVQHIQQHAAATLSGSSSAPLFVYAAYQGVHYPLQVPKQYFDRYTSQGANTGDCVWDQQGVTHSGRMNGFSCSADPAYPSVTKPELDCHCNRLLVKAQVSALSDGVGNLTKALQATGMWANTVLVFQG